MRESIYRYLAVAIVCILIQFQVFAETPAHQRLINLSHTSNTRDLGGYTTADGQQVKWGLLYRSDSLAELDEGDIDIVEALGVTTVVDFRAESEREGAVDQLPVQDPPIDYQVVSVNNPALDVKALGRKVFSGELNEMELEDLLDRSAYIDDPRLRDSWGGWLRSLAQPGALPQLFHCTAGKDRTGFAAALVLLALGVERDQVMEDFLASNHYLGADIEAGVARIQQHSNEPLSEELIRQVLGVSPSSLEGAIATMEARYGSVQGYLEQGLGLDEETQRVLRALLLEDRATEPSATSH